MVDMILSAVSVALVLLILSSCHRSFLDIQMERHSVLLSVIGCALITTSTLKFFSWFAELYILRSIGNIIRYTFIHYTIDEPLWIALNIAVGTSFLRLITFSNIFINLLIKLLLLIYLLN